ncbi:MAG: HDIG domain-containing protein [Paludibacteraceae bacterium]|nr:HDIG domain-containing protein [Paludibacteraceae bacterium]
MAAKKESINIVNRVLLFIASVVIIMLSYPKDAQFQYQYELGKPWQYDLLTADFDFPIYKDKAQLRAEREDVLNNKVYYFYDNNDICTDALKKMRTYVEQLIEGETEAQYISYLKREMEYMYKSGIMEDSQYDVVHESGSDHIVVLGDNNMGKLRGRNDVYSLSKAKKHIRNNMPEHLKHEIFDKINLDAFLSANLVFDEDITDKALSEEYKSISATQGMVQRGERIIDRGEIVTEQKFLILNSLKQETLSNMTITSNQKIMSLMGIMLIIAIFLGLFYLYSYIFRKHFFQTTQYCILTLMLITVYAVMTSLIVQFAEHELVYLIPYALIPMVISTFYDTRTALFTHWTTVLICVLFVAKPLEFVMLQIPAGMISIYMSKDLEDRSQFMRTALAVVATYCFIYFSFNLLLNVEFVSGANMWMFLWFVINGIMLLFAYPLVFFVEKTFKFTSNVTLLELSNTNTPLLRQLSEEAPGTFQHSSQVSNLAADVTSHLGGNTLMARTGALYHDIGKLRHPAFYTENQYNGVNPHVRLKPEESATVIISHVRNGVEIAKQNKLPQCLIDIIMTHHATGKAKFFYNTWINENPGKQIDESKFTYDGPNPFTKEQGIIMICDAVEAASRSLSEYTDDSIGSLVDKIIDGILQDHFLDNTPIKMNQMEIIKSVLKERLRNIYHTRVAYPDINFKGKSNFF